jgi:NADH-quinone oxidoreductase subunit A
MIVSNFGIVLIFIVGGVLFLNIGLIVAKLLRPHKPNEEKLSSYESGENAVGSAWNKFNIKYFSIALIFVLFEVESLMLFPCAVVFDNLELGDLTQQLWQWFALAEIGLFVFVLILALAFAWRFGYIDWLKPDVEKIDFKGSVPKSMYQDFNKKYS